MSIPLEHCLIFSAVLFALGLFGIAYRRDIIFILLAIEVMFNASGFAFISISSHLGTVDGQIMFFVILTVAAAEVAIGLGLTLKYERLFGTLTTDAASQMKG